MSADRQPVMARQLDGVPALVIDYDRDFDLQDSEAKASYAQQVGDYFKWVEDYRCHATLPPPAEMTQVSKSLVQDSIRLPALELLDSNTYALW